MSYSRLVLFISLVSFVSAVDANRVGGGHVSMVGQIQESACAIHTDDVWQEIFFGTVTQRSILDSTKNITKPLTVRLVNCEMERENGSFWNNIEVTFEGDHDPNDIKLFAVNGSAKGLGMELTDAEGNFAIPGEALNPVAIFDGDNELHYTLHLVKNGAPLKDGEWYSAMRFVVVYH